MKKKRNASAPNRENADALAEEMMQNESTDSDCAEDGALSDAELQMLRVGLAQSGADRSKLPPHDTSERARLMRFARKNKLMVASVIVIVLALLVGIGLGIYALIAYFDSRPNTSDFTVTLGQDDPFTVKYDDAVRDGVLYVEMKRIAEFTDSMIVSGTKVNRKFTAADGTSVKFENGSDVAVINGERVALTATPLLGGDETSVKAIVSETECWVPYDFLRKVVSEGMIFRLDTEENTIVIKHVHYVTDGDKENAEPADILFDVGELKVLAAPTVPPEYEWTYAIDIEPYLDAITKENLLLANKSHPLGEKFSPELVTLPSQYCWSGEAHQLQPEAAEALDAMMKEMQRAGIADIMVTSSYRSYAQQNYLFDKYVSEHMAQGMTQAEAEAEAATYSARPGQSEHQTGLCLDFTTDSINGGLNNDFAKTDAFRWLWQNAYKFGFVLRYPEHKVELTQYSYESWHYRFVGREAATEMYFADLCLEEYLGEAEIQN